MVRASFVDFDETQCDRHQVNLELTLKPEKERDGEGKENERGEGKRKRKGQDYLFCTYFNFYVDIPARVKMIRQIFLEEDSRL